MDEQTSCQDGPICQIPVLPERPSWQVEHFDNFFENFDFHDAVHTVQDIWMDWSIEVEEILKSMGDRLLELDIPDGTMVDLIRMASRYPSRPGVPTEEDDADWVLQTLTQTVQRRIHREWEFWADQIQPLYDSMAESIASYQPTPPSNAAVANEQNAESIYLLSRSISRHALSTYDLRRVFREMLQPDNTPNIGMDAQRQLMALLDLLFEAERGMDEMTDQEAEVLVDMLYRMHVGG
ncbi:MAG: hypothetical protein Q9217_005748 [Psora testacea]